MSADTEEVGSRPHHPDHSNSHVSRACSVPGTYVKYLRIYLDNPSQNSMK